MREEGGVGMPHKVRRGLSLRWLVVLLVGVTVASVSFWPARASADADEADIRVVPAELSLQVGATGQVDVLVRGRTSTPLKLSSVPVAGLSVAISTVERSAGTTRWRVRLRWSWERVSAAEVVFEVARSGATIGVASLSVTPVPPVAVDEVVKVSLMTTLTVLQEGRPRDVDVMVHNVSTMPVSVESVSAVVSPDGRICPGRWASGAKDATDPCPRRQSARLPQSVSPGAVKVFRFRVEAVSRSQSGDHEAVFTTRVSFEEAGARRRAEIVSAHRFSYAVLGESEFLTGVGVPSFLLLPGFLALMAYRIPARRAAARGVELPALDVSAPEFVAVSATLSILAIPVYWSVTWALGSPRTYLQGYGVRDLIAVWIVSAGTGFMAFALPWAWSRVSADRRTPRTTDDPRTLLRRLARAGGSLVLPQVRFAVGPGQTRQGFRLPAGADRPDEVWCTPAIACFIDPAAPAPRVSEVQNALRGSAQELWRVVRGRQDVTLSWAPGTLQHPVRVTPEAITDELAPAPVLRESLTREQRGP
jgi:hypothetical protein